MTKPRIMLVDDSEDILSFLSLDLSNTYEIETAQNGEAALMILSEKSVSLVVSDIMMPVMDGFELCQRIKSNLNYSHIPVILLTAKNNLQSKIEGLELGADAYIEKPFSPKHLHVQIANLLSNRSKIKNYFANSPLAHINTMACSKEDETFLAKLNDVIVANLANTELNVDHLAELMNMSRSTLYRKINAISDLSANELINLTRLKKAAELLIEGRQNIYEVSQRVGYCSQTYFGRNFSKQFGLSPSEFIKQHEEAGDES